MSEGQRRSWAGEPDATLQEPVAGCITGPKKCPHTHITTILRKPCRFLTQALPTPSLIPTKTFPIPCTAKFSIYLGKYSDTLDRMTIVISHISAIEYWLAHESLKPKATSAHAATELPSAGPTIDDRRRVEQLLKQCASIPLHIAATKPLHNSTRFRCHVWSPPVARALYRIADDVYVCSPELAFFQSAATLDKIDTVRLGCELCATYSIDRHARGGFFQRNAITTREKLGAVVRENQGANGIKTARWALNHVLDRSASPAETKVALALTLPCKIGGMGLPQPSLNRFIPLNAAEQKALNRSYFLCDLYWEQAKLAIEYDSDAEHSGSERIASDAARRNALLRLGITVITVGNQTFRDRSEFKRVGATVARLLGTRIRPRSEHYDRRQIELRKRLSSQPIWESARYSK